MLVWKYSSLFQLLCTRERTHSTYWIGDWVGLRVGLEAVPGIEPIPSSPQHIVVRLSCSDPIKLLYEL
jgi:hypothetical protein